MSDNNLSTNPVLSTQLSLERLREYFAGGIAILIILSMLLIGLVAVFNLGAPVQFQAAKDLLLIITPFVGVVIGYYFNKVTTDSRAVALQRAADAASATAMSATAESERAQQQAQQATAQANQIRGALTDIVSASEGVNASHPGNLGMLGPDNNGATSDAQINFRLALERARRALNE